jgi:ferric-dicitrate binding protein FerR (iron transport regulator)
MTDERDYLWDRSGPADPLVTRLETLLRPLAHSGRQAPQPRRAWFRALAAAAAVLLAAAAWWFVAGRQPGPVLRVAGEPRELREQEWFVAERGPSVLELDRSLGRLRLAPGSRLQVRRLRQEQALLYLAVGQLEASVSIDAKPRFFQIETPVTTCVDLGCRYVLTVAEDGATHVRVVLGQVAFESADGERYVPMGAECKALGGGRLGTPRFPDVSRDFLAVVDRFDRATGSERRELADKAASMLAEPRETLSLWHWLADPDPAVRAVAAKALRGQYDGPPDGDPAAWKRHLEGYW